MWVCVCAWGGVITASSGFAAQSCLFCGTSVGCVIGFVDGRTVSEVKQTQSRAALDAIGTSGLVSLRLCTCTFGNTPWRKNTKLRSCTSEARSVLGTKRNPAGVLGIL